MKTLVYIDPQSYGNLALYDYSLLKGINDFKVIYCCNKQYDAPILENIEYYPIFKYRSDMSSLAKSISYICSLCILLRILMREKPDTLHVQWWKLWGLDYIFLALYKVFVKQVIFTAHNLVPHDSGESMKEKCGKYYKRVDKIIVHDLNSKKELVSDFGIYAEKVCVIPHGILDFKVNEDEVGRVQTEIEEKYKLRGKLVFASMGGQNPYKGTDLIRDAFLSSDFLKNNPDIFLIIAGKGTIVNQGMFKKTSKNIWVANYLLTDSEFQAVMRLTDVMLLPYRKISQSGVLLTTIQNQIPFAVTPVGGLTEPFDTASVGWVIPSATIEDVRITMEKLAKDVKDTKAVKNDQLAWNKVKERYNWNNISKQTEVFYKL